MAIIKKIENDELYLYMNGNLIYKRCLKTGQSKVFDVMAYDKYTLTSITVLNNDNKTALVNVDTRIEIAIDALKANGWTFQTSDQKFDWWIDEAFELSSIWNPVGAKIYFILDVDPEATAARRKGELIVSVSVSKSIPATRLSTEQTTFYLSALDSNGVQKLIARANELRNEFKNAIRQADIPGDK